MELGLSNLENTMFMYMLNEERGVYKTYEPLAEEIYNAIINTKPRMLSDSLYMFRLMRYVPKTESFIGDITIMCFIGMDKESSFDIIENELNLSKEIKLKNCIIRMFVNKDRNNNIPDKNDFIQTFCHELHHAYRYYCIISKNNGKLTDGEELSNSILKSCQKYSELINDKDDESFGKYTEYLVNMIYLANNNEINAYSSEVYEYLKQHSDINQYNFAENLSSIPVYSLYNKLKSCLILLDKEKDDMSLKQASQSVCDKILHIKSNVNNSNMKLRQYLAHKLEKFQSQFFKVAKNALYDLGRYGKTNEDFIRDIKISNQLMEILNR